MTAEATVAADVISPCPGCGSDKGAHVRIINRPKKKEKKSVLDYRTVRIPQSWLEMSSADVDAPEEKISVQRRFHPYKYLSVIGLQCGRNPIINPPKPEVKQVTESMRNFAQYFALRIMILIIPFEIAPLYFQKHPEECEQMKEDFDKHVLPAHRIMWKVMKSGFDDRWDRSLVEWVDILITAIKKSPRKAREKHYGLTPDGERIKLSINRIKQMKPWLWDMVKDLPEHWSYYVAFITYIFEGVKRDPELYKELKRLEQKYNHMLRDDLIKSWENDSRNQNQTSNKENQHYYMYFEFRHHDVELYEKQKQSKRKSNPDGWKTCCTLKPSQFAKIKLNDENFQFYKRMIEVMNTNVYKCLDTEKQAEIWYDAHKMLVDIGWPKRLAWEKVFADIFESKLRKRYREAEQKGIKPDYSRLDSELDEALHKVYRSDGFRQIKLKPN
jgi:hypothetical protein